MLDDSQFGSDSSLMLESVSFQRRMKQNCLFFTFYCCNKDHDKKQRGEERVDLAYSSESQFIIEGSRDKNLSRAGIWRQEVKQKS